MSSTSRPLRSMGQESFFNFNRAERQPLRAPRQTTCQVQAPFDFPLLGWWSVGVDPSLLGPRFGSTTLQARSFIGADANGLRRDRDLSSQDRGRKVLGLDRLCEFSRERARPAPRTFPRRWGAMRSVTGRGRAPLDRSRSRETWMPLEGMGQDPGVPGWAQRTSKLGLPLAVFSALRLSVWARPMVPALFGRPPKLERAPTPEWCSRSAGVSTARARGRR